MKSPYILIDNTKDAFKAILDAIKSAEKSIKLQFFTFEGDAVGLQVAEELIKKAHEGIRVQVMIDDLTLKKINGRWVLFPWVKIGIETRPHFLELQKTKEMISKMEDAGIGIVITNKLNFFLYRRSITRRCHKKIVVIDEKIAFIGGLNLSEHNYSWQDTFTQIKDQIIVNELSRMFTLKYKYNITEKALTVINGTEIFQSTNRLMTRMSALIKRAKQHIYIESPYFKDEKLIKILNNKAKEGVKVQIFLPEKSNSKYIRYFHYKYARQYSQLITFIKSPTKMIHTKLALIDNYSIFGSSNFLNIKLLDNHEEVSLIIKDTEYAKSLEKFFLNELRLNN